MPLHRNRPGAFFLAQALFAFATLAWIFQAATPSLAQENPVEEAQREILLVESKNGTHRFQVELALNAEERNRGLMERQSLPPASGMLFLFEPPRRVGMWMKNTLIPLDMLFIDSGGIIRFIAHRRQPHSLDVVSAPVLTKAVLEIIGGQAAELGIAVGDKVRHRLLPAANQEE